MTKSLEEIAREGVWQVPAFRATVKERIVQLHKLSAEARSKGQIKQAEEWEWEAEEMEIAWRKYYSDSLND